MISNIYNAICETLMSKFKTFQVESDYDMELPFFFFY